MPEGEDAAGAHVQLRMPGGFSLEPGTAESARLWHAGWRADPARVRVVTGFSLPAREAVGDRYAGLTAAGYAGGSRRPLPSGVPGMRSWPVPAVMTPA